MNAPALREQPGLLFEGDPMNNEGSDPEPESPPRRVYVYHNFHKGCLSVRAMDGPDKGRVVAYAEAVELAGCEFKCGEAARSRIASGGVKEVHAGVQGTLVRMDLVGSPLTIERLEGVRVTYNPRRDAGWNKPEAERAPIARATRVTIHRQLVMAQK